MIRWYPCSADGAPRELIAALDDGSVDFTMSLSRDDVRGLKSIRKLFQAGMSTAFLALNTERPHFAVVALRRTIAAALDRHRLTALCYDNPLAFVARGVLPPGLGGGAEGMRYEPVTEGERGDPSELPRRLTMVRVWGPRPYLPRPDAVAAAIEEQLRPLGVVVETIAATDSEHYLELLTAGDYDLALCGWVADTTDPVDYLEAVLAERSIPAAGRPSAAAGNYSRWRDVEAERGLVEARRLGGAKAIDAIQARVSTEIPLVPLMHGPRVVAHAWRVKGYDSTADLFPDFSVLELDDVRRR